MKKYQITWLNNQTDILEGRNIIHALKESGYNNSIVDYIKNYKEVK
jgi:hypothetical protein